MGNQVTITIRKDDRLRDFHWENNVTFTALQDGSWDGRIPKDWHQEQSDGTWHWH